MVPTAANRAIDCANAYQLAVLRSEVTGQPVDAEDTPGDAETGITLPNRTALSLRPGVGRAHHPEGNEFRILPAEAERAALPPVSG
ncbi:hypothetical protein ACW69C_14250 [Streptomyces sp. MN3]|uniref:hypothetical protein n=1 Tax=Streptomyces sp. yara TaxID=3458421 RepID=UPI004040150E